MNTNNLGRRHDKASNGILASKRQLTAVFVGEREQILPKLRVKTIFRPLISKFREAFIKIIFIVKLYQIYVLLNEHKKRVA